jgi:uncharacterized protein YdeI (YjbR/CyaY-like superfamily)
MTEITIDEELLTKTIEVLTYHAREALQAGENESEIEELKIAERLQRRLDDLNKAQKIVETLDDETKADVVAWVESIRPNLFLIPADYIILYKYHIIGRDYVLSL